MDFQEEYCSNEGSVPIAIDAAAIAVPTTYSCAGKKSNLDAGARRDQSRSERQKLE